MYINNLEILVQFCERAFSSKSSYTMTKVQIFKSSGTERKIISLTIINEEFRLYKKNYMINKG